MTTKTVAFPNNESMESYLYYIQIPLKLVGCWDLFPNTDRESRIIINAMYLAAILFVLTYIPMALTVYLYSEWEDIMASLDKLADSLPVLVSVIIVAYYAMYRHELYELVEYMDKYFKYHSAQGLTNMTMFESCKTARRFARVYTACCMFSVNMYTIMPVVVHLWTKTPLQNWLFMDITRSPFFEFVFLTSYLAQLYIGLAMGQFGVFFAANSILICGQLDLLCCSLRNARYTALLKHGVKHSTLMAAHGDIRDDEKHNYMYNIAEMKESNYHYDQKTVPVNISAKTQYDIYSAEYDHSTTNALRDCASLCQVVYKYKEMFEKFVSPLLVVRVVQVTLYLCTLLYTATLKFEMITVEYLAAVALDIFVYCYYGNQIILQIIKTSFSYYTLLVNVNEK